VSAPSTVAATSGSTTGQGPDPLGQLSFRVEIAGMEIGRFAECTGLAMEYEMLAYEEGGNNQFVHLLRGRARYPNLILSRGVTHEDAFVKWLFAYQREAQRPTLTVTLLDSGGRPVRRFSFASAFPIKWTGPEVTAASNGTATESLEIGHTGLV
jgi:phage tail-like protein